MPYVLRGCGESLTLCWYEYGASLLRLREIVGPEPWLERAIEEWMWSEGAHVS